jgi:ABC-type iron transport system FetAB ATPase subunit
MEQEPDVIIEVADTHLYDNGTAEFYGYSIPEILRIAYFCQENEPTLFAATVDDWLEIPAAVYADTCEFHCSLRH